MMELHMAQKRAGIEKEKSTPIVATGDLSSRLTKSLEFELTGAQTRAYGQAEAFELGKPGVALNDVMVDLQKANVAFQTGLQVRNRLVSAYQEVMNLPA